MEKGLVIMLVYASGVREKWFGKVGGIAIFYNITTQEQPLWF